MPRRSPAMALAALLAAPALALPALADTALRLDLNRAEPQDGACRLVIVAENPSADPVAGYEIEAVLFDTAGRVAALSVLDLQDLPAGRMRVRPFDLAGLDCAGIARLLVNAAACRPESAAPCATPPVWSSLSGIEVRE